MNISLNCVKLIKHFENCKLKAYLDIFGVPTIGWGHTAKVSLGMVCTQEQADKWLLEEIHSYELQVLKALNADEIEINQSQLDALVCFAYNLGTYTLVHGSRKAPVTKVGLIWKFLKAGDYNRASDMFTAYTNNGVRGLVIRRLAESMLFNGQMTIDEILDWVREKQSKKIILSE